MKSAFLLYDRINELIEITKELDFITVITETKVLQAKEAIKLNGFSTADFFLILSSINLLNASIKRKEYKNILAYAEIKGNVSRILHYLASFNYNKYDIEFYINTAEKCAYVEIFNLQFSFHNININETLKAYIDSDRNNIKPWREIRLQKIAGELFNLALEYQETYNKIVR